MSGTRVTHRTISTNALANLQANLAATQRLSDRLSSGRAIQRPSDDPSGTVTALQIRADSRAQQQFVRNADDGLGWLGVADGALSNGISTLRRARELVVQGANTGANGQQARDALATEVRTIREALLETANTRYLGRPVFGGTTAGDKAFAADGSYVGDDGTVERRVSGQSTVRADTPGRDIFTSGGQSVFALLDRVADNLSSSPDALQADLDALSGFLDRFTTGQSQVGARYARVESQRQIAQNRVLDLRSALSDVENIDLPKTVMDLQLQQVAYQASLGATARVIQPTLMDFLR
ncbi:MAG: flagellar hook-associated protein FlgL [Actinomycetes bacterium]